MAKHQSLSDYIRELAAELLEDIEVSRSSMEALVYKASRLARLMDEQEIFTWLVYEQHGFNTTDQVSLKYLALTGRWIDVAKNQAFFGPISQQEAVLRGCDVELEALKNFRPGGDYGIPQMQRQQEQIRAASNRYMLHVGIVSRVRALIHDFAFRVFQQHVFSGQASSIFDAFQDATDMKLADAAGEALAKIPHIFERLAEGEAEAVSQAMATCRRVIDAFADGVYPPSDTKARIGTEEVDVTAAHTRNRIRVYVYERIGSGSRYDRIRKILSELYDRVSAGVHKDVTASEAQALVLQTYVLLGEILAL